MASIAISITNCHLQNNLESFKYSIWYFLPRRVLS